MYIRCHNFFFRKIWVRSPIRRNTQLMDPEIVPRDMPIAIVGDTHGSYEGYLKNLQSLWVVDSSGNFTGTTERIVLVGDILGDRIMAGVPTYQHIDKLRAQGADIHVLAGNHEDFVIGYSTHWDHGGGSAFANALVNNQWKWLLEFWKFANPIWSSWVDISLQNRKYYLPWETDQMAWRF